MLMCQQSGEGFNQNDFLLRRHQLRFNVPSDPAVTNTYIRKLTTMTTNNDADGEQSGMGSGINRDWYLPS